MGLLLFPKMPYCTSSLFDGAEHVCLLEGRGVISLALSFCIAEGVMGTY